MTDTATTATARKTTKFEDAVLAALPEILTKAGFTTETVDEVSATVVGEVLDYVASHIASIALVGQATGQLAPKEVNLLAVLVEQFHVPQEDVSQEQLDKSAAELSKAFGVDIAPPPAAVVNRGVSATRYPVSGPVGGSFPGYL